MKSRTLCLALGAALSLSGCISFGAKPPPFLLRLNPAQEEPAGTARTATAGQAITVAWPIVSQELMTPRVPVHSGANQVAYLKDATWVERPARQFRRLLAETIRARGGRLVVEGDDAEIAGKTKLGGRLLDLGYDARSQSVIVRYDALHEGADGAVRTKRFEATVPGISADAKSVGPALNRAANEIAAQVAEWAG